MLRKGPESLFNNEGKNVKQSSDKIKSFTRIILMVEDRKEIKLPVWAGSPNWY
jgi:hypothetical protein